MPSSNTLATVTLTPGWATFGQTFPQGVAFGALSVGTLTTQADVKNLWPDGSIRFAVLTARPTVAGDYAITAGAANSGGYTLSGSAIVGAGIVSSGGFVLSGAARSGQISTVFPSGGFTLSGSAIVARSAPAPTATKPRRVLPWRRHR